MEAKVTGIFQSSLFLWGDGEKKGYRNWTGPRRGEEEDQPESQEGSQEPSQEQILVAQQKVYSWISERIRKIMKKASGRWIGVELNISAWRQIAIAISRVFCREEDRFELEKEKLETEEE